MKKIKEKKGITLVALIITIIVLLILAGVTVGILMGENGLLNRTIGVADTYKKAEANEIALLNQIDDIMTDYGEPEVVTNYSLEQIKNNKNMFAIGATNEQGKYSTGVVAIYDEGAKTLTITKNGQDSDGRMGDLGIYNGNQHAFVNYYKDDIYNYIPWLQNNGGNDPSASPTFPLTKISIKKGVKNVGGGLAAFSNITTLELPSGITTLGNACFDYCRKLEAITIPNTVTEIGDFALFGCASLKKLVLPDSVIKMGDSITTDCSSVTEFVISKNIEYIERYIFTDMSALETIVFRRETAPTISERCFYPYDGIYNDKLTKIIVPKGAIDSYEKAFGNVKYTNSLFAKDIIIDSEPIQTAWKGKKIAFLGDSITEAVQEYPVDNWTWIAKPYHYFMQQILELNTVYNLGISSTHLAGSKYSNSFVNRYTSIPSDAEVIMIMGGTNDFLHDDTAEFGKLGDTTPDTFYGGVATLITGIQQRYPKAKLIILTPLHHKFENNLNIKTNKNFNDYVNAIKEVATKYNVSYIDLYKDSRLDNSFITNYSLDGVHPSQRGHKIIADVIIEQLKNIK